VSTAAAPSGGYTPTAGTIRLSVHAATRKGFDMTWSNGTSDRRMSGNADRRRHYALARAGAGNSAVRGTRIRRPAQRSPAAGASSPASRPAETGRTRTQWCDTPAIYSTALGITCYHSLRGITRSSRATRGRRTARVRNLYPYYIAVASAASCTAVSDDDAASRSNRTIRRTQPRRGGVCCRLPRRSGCPARRPTS